MEHTDIKPERHPSKSEDDLIEQPTEKVESIRPKVDTQSSMPGEEISCNKCGQLEQTLESALTMIHDLITKYTFLIRYEGGRKTLLDKYHPLLKEAFLAREEGIRELEEIRVRQKSETEKVQQQKKEIPTLAESMAESPTGVPGEIYKKLPMSKSQFKDLIGNFKLKSDPLLIEGVQHLGVIHDLCPSGDPRVYRLCGDRYIGRIHLGEDVASLLDLKEIERRKSD